MKLKSFAPAACLHPRSPLAAGGFACAEVRAECCPQMEVVQCSAKSLEMRAPNGNT